MASPRNVWAHLTFLDKRRADQVGVEGPTDDAVEPAIAAAAEPVRMERMRA